MDNPKSFDLINHKLLILILEAYGFPEISSEIIRSYLKNRKKRVNVNSSFSEWETSFTGVPQGPIICPLLFNIYLNDLFLVVTHSHVSNYADANTALVTI